MESLIVPFLCFGVVALSLLWVVLVKRQIRLRRDRNMQRRVDAQLEYERRLNAERNRRGEN